MADQSDVSNALVATITAILFPTPPTQLSISPLTGILTRVYVGWPVTAELNADLAATPPVINVSVYPTRVVRNTTRYPTEPYTVSAPSPTLTTAVAGNAVTFGGTGGAGQVAGVKVGASARTLLTYTFRLAASDTPATVAAAFASTIPAATASGPVLTLPGGPVAALVEADVTTAAEYRRTEQNFMVTIWSNDPATRDSTASAIDAQIAALTFLTYPDGTCGRIRMAALDMTDASENDNLYRRDLVYSIEYPTTVVTISPRMIVGIENVIPANGPIAITLTS